MGIKEEAFKIINNNTNLPDGIRISEESKKKLKKIVEEVLRDEGEGGSTSVHREKEKARRGKKGEDKIGG